MSGATAPKLDPMAHARPRAEQPPAEQPSRSSGLATPIQGSLFPVRSQSNVIPFEAYVPAKPAPRPQPKTAGASQPGTRSASRPSRRASRVPDTQERLDFLPPAPPKPRTLGTTVEAVIYCEAPVATALHRAVAGALDWSMVLIGYGLFLATFFLMGGGIALDKLNLMIFGGALLLVGFLYGWIFAIAGSETPGMRWTHLRLTTFDGFRPELRQRLLRLLGSCLSLCTVVGLLWSLADEESLTWQDHISRTFLTPRGLESQVFQRR
jgi:uncharacterized RDD family membrane protein YckC